MSPATAAIVVVGSEVLSAKVQDENGPYLARRLRDLGVELTAHAMVMPVTPAVAAAATEDDTTLRFLRAG